MQKIPISPALPVNIRRHAVAKMHRKKQRDG